MVEGSQKAFRRFLTALCCGNSSMADDIAQESYIKAYLSSDGLEDLDKFNAWLYKIGYNTFINSLRSEHRHVDPEVLDAEEASEKSDKAFRYEALYMALDRIPTNERTAILLFYMDGYQVKEIAGIIDRSEDSVRQYLTRGRFHLRQLLKS